MNFNPRTHGECDRSWIGVFVKPINFNPRTHGECDLVNLLILEREMIFQSTHSRGVRPIMQMTI